MSDQAYPFGPDWLGSVRHDSAEWREYCEARCLVRRFIQTEIQSGREAAIFEWRDHLDLMVRVRATAVRIRRLEQLFSTIGRHEGEVLRAELRRERDATARLQAV